MTRTPPRLYIKLIHSDKEDTVWKNCNVGTCEVQNDMARERHLSISNSDTGLETRAATCIVQKHVG